MVFDEKYTNFEHNDGMFQFDVKILELILATKFTDDSNSGVSRIFLKQKGADCQNIFENFADLI